MTEDFESECCRRNEFYAFLLVFAFIAIMVMNNASTENAIRISREISLHNCADLIKTGNREYWLRRQ